MKSLNKMLNSRFPHKNLQVKDILLEKELNLKSHEVSTLLESLQDQSFENPNTGDFEPYTMIKQDTLGRKCLVLRPEALPVLKEEMSGYTPTFLAKELNVNESVILQELRKLNDKTFKDPQTGEEKSYTKIARQTDGTSRLTLQLQALDSFKKQIQNLTSGYTPSTLEKELGISAYSVSTLLRTLQLQTFLNPLTGEKEPYTKTIIKKSGESIVGLRSEALGPLKDEMTTGYRPVALAQKIHIVPNAANIIIKNLTHKTFTNKTTGKEEPYTRTIRHETGKLTIGLREEALPELQKLMEGYAPSSLTEQFNMTTTAIQALFQTLQNQTFLNPQTKTKEPYVKTMLTTWGRECLGLRPQALEVLKQEMTGYSLSYVSKDLRAKPEVIQSILQSLKNQTYWNPLTKKEEPYIKMMRDSTGNWCLGLQVDAKGFFAGKVREISEGCSALHLSRVLKIDLDTAEDIIQSLKDKTFLNPNTGKEEACTKQMTRLSSGETSLALRLEALQWVQDQFKKDTSTPRAFTISALMKELNVSKETAKRWINEVRMASFFNPVTNKEEPYTERSLNSRGRDALGIRVEAWEIFKKEYAKKIQQYRIKKEQYDKRMGTLQKTLSTASSNSTKISQAVKAQTGNSGI